MSHTNYQRRQVYRRDTEDARGQGVFAWSPGATISTQQAANMLGVSDDTVRDMCESNELESFVRRPDKKGSPIRVLKESVHRHMAKVLDRYALPAAPGLPDARKASSGPRKI